MCHCRVTLRELKHGIMRIADFVRQSNERITLLYNNLSRTWRSNGECAGFRPRFPLDQTFCSERPEIGNIRANGKAFWGISAKKDNLARLAQILDNFSPGISVTVLFDFLEPGIFGLVVWISKSQLTSEFPETLLENFRTVYAMNKWLPLINKSLHCSARTVPF